MKPITLVALSFLVIICSIAIDIQVKNELFVVFQRSGSLIVIFGFIFESKYILRLSECNTLYIEGELIIHESVYGEIPKVKFFSTESLMRHTGFYAAIIGTAIWGYGDLVAIFFT